MRSCVLLLTAAACQRDATAQIPTDPLGPVRCFQGVTAAGLSEQSAIELCAGAINAAPGRCYVAATDRFGELSSEKVQRLCAGTTTLQPVSCYAKLAAADDLSEDQIISYCATECAAGPPPPQTPNPGCADLAIDRTNLPLQKIGELCAGSRSTGPALCYKAGFDLHLLADDQLIRLCAEAAHCQYAGGYGGAPGSRPTY